MQYLHFAIILRPRGLVRPRKSSCRLSALHLSGLATELVLLQLFKYPLFFFFSTNPDPPVRARHLVSPRGTLLRHARLSLLLRGPTQLGNPTEQVPKGAGPSGRKQGQLKCYVRRLIIGSLGNENGKKTNRLAQLCMCNTIFFTFLSGPHCTTTSKNFLISRFMEDENTWQRFFLSICKLRYSPLEFNWKIANI